MIMFNTKKEIKVLKERNEELEKKNKELEEENEELERKISNLKEKIFDLTEITNSYNEYARITSIKIEKKDKEYNKLQKKYISLLHKELKNMRMNEKCKRNE